MPKISELTDSGAIQPGDSVPAGRGGTTVEVWPTVEQPASVAGTDTYTADFGVDVATGDKVCGDFANANTTTTPTLENTGGTPGALTITTRDGSALWAGALSGVHELQLNADGTAWLVLDPNPVIPESTAKTGADSKVVSGTAGADGNLAQWNAGGDAVDSGVAVPSNGFGALIPLAQATANGDATIDFTSVFDTTYDEYVVFAEDVVPSSDADRLRARVSNDGGATWDTGATDYSWANQGNRSDGTSLDDQSNSEGSVSFNNAGNVGNTSGESASYEIWIANPFKASNNRWTQFRYKVSAVGSGASSTTIQGAGHRRNAQADDSVRLFFNGGNIATGNFRLYGVKKS